MSKKEDLEKKKKIEELKKAREKSGVLAGRTFAKNTEKRDAENEIQTYERYKKVGVSPIYSKGNFTANSQNLDDKYGSRLTEDDKVSSMNKKKKKQQY